MQIMIGCAKDMRSTCPTELPLRSEPLFADRAAANVMQLMGYTEEELCGVLGCNAQIARENRLRYVRFADGDGGLQAVMAYSGIVFKYLDAGSFSPADCDFAQRHLWITSFLYGLLRPMDVIKPYRLEGGVVLPANGVSMFDYWKPVLTDVLIDSVKADDGVLVDLASSEMRRLFDWRRVARAHCGAPGVFCAARGAAQDGGGVCQDVPRSHDPLCLMQPPGRRRRASWI